MGKCRNKENDCHDESRHETRCSNHAASREKHANPCHQSPGESSKKCHAHDGWTFRWTTPEQQSVVRSIVPGPFLRPKLLHALPYALASNCRDCSRRRNDQKLRNGIPDPWFEYLAWKEKRFPKDVRFCWEYMWLTDYVWNSRGLAMLQGIPDPWRADLDCSCLAVEHTTNLSQGVEVEETRKEPRRSKDKDRRERVSRDLPRRDSKGKDDEKKVEEEEKKQKAEEEKKKKAEEEKKKKERNGYERVKDRMTELEDELRSKDVGKKRIPRCCDKAAGSKRTSKCKNGIAKKVIDSEKPEKKVCPGTSKDHGGKAPKMSFDGVNDRIMRCNDDIAKIREDARLAREKIRKLKEKKEASSRRKSSLCAGNCGRVLPNEKLLKSIKLNDEAASSSVDSAREFLREINERIAITKNALKSPELQRRERGAGDNANEVIDLRQHSLFARSGISIERRIPDRGDSERRELRESEVLIVEAFSEQD